MLGPASAAAAEVLTPEALALVARLHRAFEARRRELLERRTRVQADLDGPGTLRHIWMTFPPAAPEIMRAMVLEVFYDGLDEPSVSAPCLDFFGLTHGLISQQQYSELVTVVILSAFVPTLIAQQLFQPVLVGTR